jgi:hypothetical protein
VLIPAQQLLKNGDLDDQRKEDLTRGIEAASSVLAGTNDAIAREERIEAVEELKTLVEDWKGHRIEGFGELLLYGQFTVLKGDSMSSKNEERDVSATIPFPLQLTNAQTVQNLPFRNDSPLLQGNQRQQAQEQNVNAIARHKGWKAQTAAKRPHFHAKRYRDNLAAETRYVLRSETPSTSNHFPRLLYVPDFLERRSGNRKLHYPLHFRGDHEEMGHPGRHPTACLEGPRKDQRWHDSLFQTL